MQAEKLIEWRSDHPERGVDVPLTCSTQHFQLLVGRRDNVPFVADRHISFHKAFRHLVCLQSEMQMCWSRWAQSLSVSVGSPHLYTEHGSVRCRRQKCSIHRVCRKRSAYFESLRVVFESMPLKTFQWSVQTGQSSRIDLFLFHSHSSNRFSADRSGSRTLHLSLLESTLWMASFSSSRHFIISQADVHRVVQPTLVTGFKQPLQMNDFATFDMLPFIPLHYTLSLPLQCFLSSTVGSMLNLGAYPLLPQNFCYYHKLF